MVEVCDEDEVEQPVLASFELPIILVKDEVSFEDDVATEDATDELEEPLDCEVDVVSHEELESVLVVVAVAAETEVFMVEALVEELAVVALANDACE